jgi:hypothetical protein
MDAASIKRIPLFEIVNELVQRAEVLGSSSIAFDFDGIPIVLPCDCQHPEVGLAEIACLSINLLRIISRHAISCSSAKIWLWSA